MSSQLKTSKMAKRFFVLQRLLIKIALATVTLKLLIHIINKTILENKTANFHFQAIDVIFAKLNLSKM